MRILIATPDLPPDGGGIGTYTDLLAKGLRACGDEVAVVKGDVGPVSNHYRYPYAVVRLRKGKLLGATTLGNIGKLRSEVRKRQADAIICTNWNTFGMESLVLSKIERIPYLVVVHCMELVTGRGSVRHRIKRRIMVRVLLGASRIIAVSGFTRDLLVSVGVPAEKVRVIHNGIDLRKQSCNGSKEALAETLGIAGRKVILTVSRIEHYKGIGKVLEVLADVEKTVGDIVYIVVGEGSARADLMQQAAELGVTGNVVFTGRVSEEELPDYYGLADLFVLPSREVWNEETEELLSAEGFGLVIAEASAWGVPVIAGKSGGTREVIEDGVTGFLIDPGEREQLLRSIVSVLSDHSLAHRLGESGRRKTEKDFDVRDKVELVRMLIMDNL
jgi:phosphatidylinositol alpha-1,6-mannosyltransferase